MRNQAKEKKIPIVSVGSGKGGAGKTVVSSNLALLLARQGMRVVLADLDVGGANIHVMFGQFKPGATLADFLNRKVESLNEVAVRSGSDPNLKIIVGAGETLRTANVHYATKIRLIRAFQEMDADLVLVDVGPGTGYHSLDFFLLGDIQVAVTTPDPASVVDVYRFIKLAVLRKAVSPFFQRDWVTESLATREFMNIEDVLETVEQIDPESRPLVERAVADFRPCLVLNRISEKRTYNIQILRSLLKEYTGKDLNVLGSIPEDEAVQRSVSHFSPVVAYEPQSQASVAFHKTARSLQLMLSMLPV